MRLCWFRHTPLWQLVRRLQQAAQAKGTGLTGEPGSRIGNRELSGDAVAARGTHNSSSSSNNNNSYYLGILLWDHRAAKIRRIEREEAAGQTSTDSRQISVWRLLESSPSKSQQVQD